MNIKITKYKKCQDPSFKYEADCIDLPGSPPVGRGENKYIALLNLFIGILSNHNTLKDSLDLSYIKYIEKEE